MLVSSEMLALCYGRFLISLSPHTAISAATQALELANGYLVHDQPLVITYSRGS